MSSSLADLERVFYCNALGLTPNQVANLSQSDLETLWLASQESGNGFLTPAAANTIYQPLTIVPLVVDGVLLRQGVGGSIWRGTGYNATFVPNVYSASQTLTGQAIDKYFASLRPNSLTRLRAYAPPVSSGISWAAQLVTLDAVVKSARKHGQRLAMCFTTWSNIDATADAYGGKTSAWFTSSLYKHSVSGALSYEDWVTTVVTRYTSTNDGTVSFYDLCNEPSDSGANSVSAAAFVSYMSGIIKAINPSALVYMGIDVIGSVGGASAYQTINTPADVCSTHIYNSQGTFDPINPAMVNCRVLGKPILIDEVGWWAKGKYGSIGDSDLDTNGMPAMTWEAQASMAESFLRSAFSIIDVACALIYSYMDSSNGTWYTGIGRYDPLNGSRTRDVINTIPLQNEYQFNTDTVTSLQVWLDSISALRALPGTPIDGSASGNYVWFDRANNQSVSQATTANAPTMQQALSSDGSPSMAFDGTQYVDYNLLHVGDPAGTYYTVYTPTAFPSVGNYHYIWGPQSSGANMAARVDSRGRVQLVRYGSGLVIGQGITSLKIGKPNLIMVRWDSVGGTYEVAINGQTDVTGSNAQSLTATFGRIGADANGANGVIGQIHDFLYKPVNDGAPDISRVNAYLTRKHRTNTSTSSRSREEIRRGGLGWVSLNYGPEFVVTANRTPATQTIYALAVAYKAGDIVRNIEFDVAVAAAGTNVTGMYAGIADAGGNLLETSANTNTAASWPLGYVAIPLSAPAVIPADGIYYHLLLQNGTFGTTQPAFNSTSLVSNTHGSAVIYGLAGTGQTTLGTPGSTQLTIVGTGTSWPLWTGST